LTRSLDKHFDYLGGKGMNGLWKIPDSNKRVSRLNFKDDDDTVDMNNNEIFDTENQTPHAESKSKKRKIASSEEHQEKRASSGQPLKKKIAY
jgi:hypothetical protein